MSITTLWHSFCGTETQPDAAQTTLLCCATADSQEQESLAAAIMDGLPDTLQQQGLGQLTVALQGLSTFRNQVGAQ